jgi:hypothetical protein
MAMTKRIVIAEVEERDGKPWLCVRSPLRLSIVVAVAIALVLLVAFGFDWAVLKDILSLALSL